MSIASATREYVQKRLTALPRLNTQEQRGALFGVLMVIPAVVLVLAVALYPFLYSMWTSVHRIDFFTTPPTWTFVGLGNYTNIWSQAEFVNSFLRTFYFAFLAVVGSTGLGLLIAVLLNERMPGRGIWRSLIIIPWAMAGVVIGVVWSWMFNGQFGVINGFLYQFGIISDYHAYLTNPILAIHIVALTHIWMSAPLAAILFLAALQGVPQSMYNAAKVDGAGVLHRFRHVTLPWLKSMTLLILIIGTINAVMAFDLFYIMTKGGPGSSTTVFSWLGYIYAFQFFRWGEGAAVLYILSLICLILAVIYLRLLFTRADQREKTAAVGDADTFEDSDVEIVLEEKRPVYFASRGGAASGVQVKPPRISPRVTAIIRRVGLYSGVLFILLWTLVPFLMLISFSFSQTRDIVARPPSFIPTNPTLINYCVALRGEAACGERRGFGGQVTANMVPLGMRNSLIVASSVTLVNIVFGSMAGYAFARWSDRIRPLRMTLWTLMLTRMIPSIAIVIPFFILFRTMGLLDSKLGLVIAYTSIVMPITVWIMKGYFETVPTSLDRSALVDGCSRFGAFLRIIVPVSLPGIAAAAIFAFLVAWNEFIFALILTSTPETQTMPIVIAGFQAQVQVQEQKGAVFASGVMAIIPTVAVALLFQRYLVQGLTAGSTKG